MSVQTEIDRIIDAVSEQSDLISQISTALDGKAGGGGMKVFYGSKFVDAKYLASDTDGDSPMMYMCGLDEFDIDKVTADNFQVMCASSFDMTDMDAFAPSVFTLEYVIKMLGDVGYEIEYTAIQATDNIRALMAFNGVFPVVVEITQAAIDAGEFAGEPGMYIVQPVWGAGIVISSLVYTGP